MTEDSSSEQNLESGRITLLYRPRVEQPQPSELGDVQRYLLLLAPSHSTEQRLIALARKRFPLASARERFWGFVDLVLRSEDMKAALDAQVYGTKTRGVRHLPAARAFASGTYDLAAHGEHTHLRWSVEATNSDDAVARQLRYERNGDFLLSVANPDPKAWGLEESPDLQGQLFEPLEVHVALPSTIAPSLQQRFGDRKYHPVDAALWLDQIGAELLFVGSGAAAHGPDERGARLLVRAS